MSTKSIAIISRMVNCKIQNTKITNSKNEDSQNFNLKSRNHGGIHINLKGVIAARMETHRRDINNTRTKLVNPQGDDNRFFCAPPNDSNHKKNFRV